MAYEFIKRSNLMSTQELADTLRRIDLEYLRMNPRPRGGAALQEYNNVFMRVLSHATGQEFLPGMAPNSPQARAAISGLGLAANAPFGAVLEQVITRAETGRPAPQQSASARNAGVAADVRIASGVRALTEIYGTQENMTRQLENDLTIVRSAVEGGNPIGDRRTPDSPETVSALQRTLIALKHSGRVELPDGFQADGRMNDATRDAVRQIQRNYGERGRAVDGVVGTGTLSALSQLSFDVRNQTHRIGNPAPAPAAPAAEGQDWVPMREGNRPNGRIFTVTTTDGQTLPVMHRPRAGEGQWDVRPPANTDWNSDRNVETMLRVAAQQRVNINPELGLRQMILGGVEARPSDLPPANPVVAPPNTEGRTFEYRPPNALGQRDIAEQVGGWQASRAADVAMENPVRGGMVTVRLVDDPLRTIERRDGVQHVGPAMRSTQVDARAMFQAAVAGDGIIAASDLNRQLQAGTSARLQSGTPQTAQAGNAPNQQASAAQDAARGIAAQLQAQGVTVDAAAQATEAAALGTLAANVQAAAAPTRSNDGAGGGGPGAGPTGGGGGVGGGGPR